MLDKIAQQLFAEIKKQCQDNDELSDDLLSTLNSVFPGVAAGALDLIDRDDVTEVVSPSGRTLFQVKGSTGTVYQCFAHANYCLCPFYKYSVIRRGEFMMCKHVLATRIAAAMNKQKKLQVTDEQLIEMLLDID